MAAPSSAYLLDGLSLPAKEEDLSGTVLATYNHFIPRKLYGTIANTCAIFYLDGIEQDINIEDLAGNIIESGFLGYCIVGSANYYMHAAARRGKLNGSLFNNSEVKLNDRIYFNDGALNTFGLAYALGAISTVFFDPIVKARYKSAYYVDSTSLMLYFRSRPFEGVGGWTSWQGISIGSQPQNTDVEYEANVGSIYEGKLWYEIYATITNIEGTYTSAVYSFYTTLKSVVLRPDSWGNSPVTYYIDRTGILPADEGGMTQLFSDVDGNNLIALEREYWTSSTYYFVYGYHPVLAKWLFLYAKDTTAPPPVFSIIFRSGGVASTYEGARDLFDLNVPSNIYNLYNDPANPNYYYSDTLGSIPPEGWYSIDSTSTPGVYSKSVYLLQGYKIYEQI